MVGSGHNNHHLKIMHVSVKKNKYILHFPTNTHPLHHLCGDVAQLPLKISLNLMICLFDLILYVPSTIFQLYRDGSSWVEPVLS